jgi:bifunctional UDP-N-acetylglucosamine pyrophosphorylase/glucosamine-1-phosphate N-acetyltransferase
MRVVRGGRDGGVVRVVDHRDLVEHEVEIDEVASGVWLFRRSLLAPSLRRVSADNAAGEIHLAGAVEVLVGTGHAVNTHETPGSDEVRGVNDRIQLAAAEAELRRRTNAAWLARGVTMLDPDRTYIDATVELAPDVTIYPGTILQGATTVGEGSEIGPDTRLVDCRVGSGSRVEHSVGQAAVIGADCRVGPFAVLAPGSEIASATVTGPFYTAQTGGS